VLSKNSSNIFLRSVGIKAVASSEASSNESKLGKNWQLKLGLLYKLNSRSSRRKVKKLRKSWRGSKRSWRR